VREQEADEGQHEHDAQDLHQDEKLRDAERACRESGEAEGTGKERDDEAEQREHEHLLVSQGGPQSFDAAEAFPAGVQALRVTVQPAGGGATTRIKVYLVPGSSSFVPPM
jgi:uncharacterized membrane protein YqiK